MRYATTLESLWVEYDGIEYYMRLKLTRPTLRILCNLSELEQV